MFGASHANAGLHSLRNTARSAQVSTETGARWSQGHLASGRRVPAERRASSLALLWGALGYPGRKIKAPLGDGKPISKSFTCSVKQHYFWPLIPQQESSKTKEKRRRLLYSELFKERTDWSLQVVCKPFLAIACLISTQLQPMFAQVQ